MRVAILALTLTLMATGGDDKKGTTDKDRMEGTWEVKACRVGGRPLTSPDGPHLITFEGDKAFMTWNGKRGAEGMAVTLDPTKTPRTIDLKGTNSEFKGIYELDGKRLRISYRKDQRPTGFDAEERKVDYELERK